ncbi:MAG: hypothetical protein ACQEW0_18805, partial [Pseudomonadota bacterium]
ITLASSVLRCELPSRFSSSSMKYGLLALNRLASSAKRNTVIEALFFKDYQMSLFRPLVSQKMPFLNQQLIQDENSPPYPLRKKL